MKIWKLQKSLISYKHSNTNYSNKPKISSTNKSEFENFKKECLLMKDVENGTIDECYSGKHYLFTVPNQTKTQGLHKMQLYGKQQYKMKQTQFFKLIQTNDFA